MRWAQGGGLSWNCPGLSVCLSVRAPEGRALSVPLCVLCARAGRAEVSRLWGAVPRRPGSLQRCRGDLPASDMAGGGVCHACRRLMGYDPRLGFFPSLSPGPPDTPTGWAAAGRCRGVSPLSLPSALTLIMSPDAICCVSSRWDLLSCSRTPCHPCGMAGPEGCRQQGHPESPRSPCRSRGADLPKQHPSG